MEAISIRNPFPGAATFYLKSTTSTMDDARRLVGMGFPPGTVVLAGAQSAGRGRFPERRWEGQADSNLLATVILARESAALPGFPLRMGLAAARAIELFCVQEGGYPGGKPRLKWPNDVLIGGRKVAGILCEAAHEATYAGFGVNLNQRSFPPPLSERATSLALAMGRPPEAAGLDMLRLLELLLDQIAIVLGEETWKSEVEDCLWRRGELIRFAEGLPESGNLVEGELVGISPEGALLVKPQGQKAPRALAAGEILPEGESRVDRGGSNHIR